MDKQTRSNPAFFQRTDVRIMLGGVLFSVLFTGLIWLAGGRLDSVELLPDQGASWYYWKLPEPTFWTRLTAWGGYLAHQITIWWLIYYAQKTNMRYTTGLHRVNVWALGANAFFILLHFVQTHIWYDGLAQDVSIFSSQGSVIVLLVWVLLMENNRRGMFFGKKLPLGKSIIRWARDYHGYYFAWAIIYTFWYHPTVSTSGHLIGFLYMFLLLLQGSLFFTRIHINRWWMVFQEFTVLIHGALVAVMQGKGMWPMFAFGFGGIFILTQMHGLGLSRRARLAILAFYGIAATWVYASPERGISKVWQLVAIPMIDYLLVLALAGIIGLILWVGRRFRGSRGEGLSASEASA